MAAPASSIADVFSFLKNSSQSLPLVDILQQRVKALLGVYDDASNELNKISLATIFDLATSIVFDSATKIAIAASDPKSALYRYGKAPADLIRLSRTGGKALKGLHNEPIVVIASIPEAGADALANALDAKWVRDPAFYPPYVAASRILKFLYFPETGVDYDPKRPHDLVPKSGEYPIENIQYSTLHMGEIKQTDDLVDVAGPGFKPPDLSILAAAQ